VNGVTVMDFAGMAANFSPYVGLAVILYAIRQTERVSNKYIPIVAIVLGVLYSFWESGGASPGATLEGLKYALLGIGTVAGVKYSIENKTKK
jgi:low temperature requirement protein LtrA